MKREYVKPIFYAEEYKFNENFATDCQKHVDPNEPLYFTVGDAVCYRLDKGQADSGHHFEAGNGKSDILKKHPEITNGTVSLFNGENCQFDWAGPGSHVYCDNTAHDHGLFQYAFCGDNADNSNHVPAFKGIPMFS